MSNVSVPIKDDMIVGKKMKAFIITLIVPSSLDPAITVDNVSRAVGIINDTTSEFILKCSSVIYNNIVQN